MPFCRIACKQPTTRGLTGTLWPTSVHLVVTCRFTEPSCTSNPFFCSFPNTCMAAGPKTESICFIFEQTRSNNSTFSHWGEKSQPVLSSGCQRSQISSGDSLPHFWMPYTLFRWARGAVAWAVNRESPVRGDDSIEGVTKAGLELVTLLP